MASVALRTTLLRRTCSFWVRPVAASFTPLRSHRCFSSAASSKVVKALDAEIGHEAKNYQQAAEIKKFLQDSPFKLEQEEGDVNMALVRSVGDRTVRIEFQLTSPFDPEVEAMGEAGASADMDSTDFSVTIENQDGAGMTFYCSTQAGEDHRFIIGNCASFKTQEMKDKVSAYNGPDFEDLDDKLQESLDEYLAEIGLDDEVCNFIDALALDKEQREYMGWLKNLKSFIEN